MGGLLIRSSPTPLQEFSDKKSKINLLVCKKTSNQKVYLHRKNTTCLYKVPNIVDSLEKSKRGIDKGRIGVYNVGDPKF